MESSTSRVEAERRRQEDLHKQIAVLQAQLTDPDSLKNVVQPLLTSPKRKQPESTLLVPPTPSPKKRKLDHRPTNIQNGLTSSRQGLKTNALPIKPKKEAQSFKPIASNVLNKLVELNRGQGDSDCITPASRSSGFTEKAPLNNYYDNESSSHGNLALKRDDCLALVEDLEPGPVEHAPPSDDPNFEKLEPNSGIRLSSRSVSHEDLQEYLRGRYYLSPSRLYSSIRLLPNKQGYDVPVPGDWVTIAVVAERGPLKFSRAPIAVGLEEGERNVERKEHGKGRGKQKDDPPKPTGKKYVNLKLIDFGAHSRSSSSATGGKAIIRGDAFLSLLLFESDSFDLVTDEGDHKPRKVYKGGSRGAFESMAKLKEGDVIALLNPRILKPYQRSAENPHPTHNILAITPESASSIIGIGRACDLGMCSALKKDKKICGNWYDKRVSNVCEWHVQAAVERQRAGRAEFSIGTTGMSTTSAPKRKSTYDPTRQWGLTPAGNSNSGEGATYIISGHIVNGSNLDSRSLYTAEGIGREGQAKAKRKLAGKDADRALKSLLERDKEGMRAVMKAREVGSPVSGHHDKKGMDSKKREAKGLKSMAEERLVESNNITTSKNGYSAEVVKQLGFDPIAQARQRRDGGDVNVQKKLDSLATVQSARKAIILGPRPGPRVRSGVMAPEDRESKGLVPHGGIGDNLIDLDD